MAIIDWRESNQAPAVTGRVFQHRATLDHPAPPAPVLTCPRPARWDLLVTWVPPPSMWGMWAKWESTGRNVLQTVSTAKMCTAARRNAINKWTACVSQLSTVARIQWGIPAIDMRICHEKYVYIYHLSSELVFYLPGDRHEYILEYTLTIIPGL